MRLSPFALGWQAEAPNATYFSETCESGGNGGADPLVRAGPPGPALLSKNQVIAPLDKPARGPAADQGVRPTICPGARRWEKYVALGAFACQPLFTLTYSQPRGPGVAGAHGAV
jgi:hypothetical protein